MELIELNSEKWKKKIFLLVEGQEDGVLAFYLSWYFSFEEIRHPTEIFSFRGGRGGGGREGGRGRRVEKVKKLKVAAPKKRKLSIPAVIYYYQII